MDGMKEKSKEKGTPSPLPIYMLLLSVFFILAGILILNISITSMYVQEEHRHYPRPVQKAFLTGRYLCQIYLKAIILIYMI